MKRIKMSNKQEIVERYIQETQKHTKKQRLRDERREKSTRERKWSPSAFGRCYRYQYWLRLGLPPTDPPDARTLRIFQAGKLFHEFVQNFLPQHQTEVKIETEDVLGFADYVPETEVTDIKSQHSNAFWWMAKSNYNITKGKFANILQLMAYAFFLNKPKGRLVFVSKDDLCIDEYIFETKKWEHRVKRELSILRAYWERQKLPKARPRAYNKKECKYCSQRTRCKNHDKNPLEGL